MARQWYGSGASYRSYVDTSEVCGGGNMQAHHEHVQQTKRNMYIHNNIYAYMSKWKGSIIKVVANDKVDLYVKINFKQSNECDEFDKNSLQMVQTSVEN